MPMPVNKPIGVFINNIGKAAIESIGYACCIIPCRFVSIKMGPKRDGP
jgi:hypothetical protein